MNTLVKLNLIALTAAAVIGCAQKQAPVTAPRHVEAASITQIGYGNRARFVTCPIGGCARPTPKTLREPPLAHDDTPPRTDGAGTLAPTTLAPVTLAPATLMAAAAPMLALTTPSQATPPRPASSTPVPVPPPQPAALPPQTQKPTPPKPADTPEPAKTSSAGAEGQPHRAYVSFAPGSARLSAAARAQLDKLVPQVKEAHKVVIKGRTDERGDSDTNDRLALRRAMAVYDHLKRAAKASDKPFKLVAKGACCYIARNDTEAGRAANRRAEIDFVVPVQASVSPPRRSPNKANSS